MPSNNIGFVITEEAFEPDPKTKVVSETFDRVQAEGILQEAEEQNRNSRIYERKDLFPEVNGKRMKELIDHGQFKGESGHPLSKELTRQQTILPHLCCVLYNKVWTDGNKIMSNFEGTNNALGADFDMDLRKGRKPAFSLRALGTIENARGKAFVRNIKIITWDHVIYPSHPGAYTTKLVTESTSLSQAPNGNDLYANNGKGMLIPITNDNVIRYLKSESANIKVALENFDIFYESMEVIGNHVQMVDKAGNVLMISLENYIDDEIRRYCSSLK